MGNNIFKQWNQKVWFYHQKFSFKVSVNYWEMENQSSPFQKTTRLFLLKRIFPEKKKSDQSKAIGYPLFH